MNGKDRTSGLVLVDGSHHRHIGAKDQCRWVGGDFRLWLQADIEPPEFDFRFTLNSGHSVAHAGLPVLTPTGHSVKHRYSWIGYDQAIAQVHFGSTKNIAIATVPLSRFQVSI